MTEARDNAGVIAPPPLLALAAVLLGLALDWLLPAYVLDGAADLAAAHRHRRRFDRGGGGLAVSALTRFRSAGTHVEPWKPSTALVTDGVFGWLRNPMYVALTLILAGLAILLASDWMLVMAFVFIAVIHFGVVKREERYLEAKFGDAYRAYKARVPRYGWPG